MPVFPVLRRFGANTLLTAAVIGSALLATACGDDGVTNAPAPQPSQARVAISLSDSAWFAGDVITAIGVVYDRNGAVVPGANITWSVSDTLVGELGAGGTITLLRAGSFRLKATAGTTTDSTTVTVRPLTVASVTINPGMSELRLERGDIVPLGVRVQGQGGRNVLGRVVTLASDDPSVAVIDAAGRVRAVGAGRTMLRATADGVSGTLPLEVADAPAVLRLTHLGQSRLPLLVGADSVRWNGETEYHEVYLETGELTMRGGAQPRYEITVRYVEYDVRVVNGRRQMQIRTTQGEYDRGIVQDGAGGELLLTSEFISPLRHTARVRSDGVLVAFRVPGDNEVLELFYRREPR